MRVLVTGGTGLVGGAVVRRLLAANHSVVLASSTPGVRAAVPRLAVLAWSLQDEGPSAAVRDALESCDGLVHCAAIRQAAPETGLAGEAQLYRDNVEGTSALMAAAVEAGVPSFVYVSATNLFGPETTSITETALPAPPNFYTAAKLAGEQLARQFARAGTTAFASLRISAPYGPGYRTRSVVPLFLERALAGEDLTLMGSGSRKQVFTFVEDIATAVETCLTRRADGLWNVAGPAAVTMRELAETVLRVVPGSRSRIVLDGRADPQEGRDIAIDIGRAARELGWQPRYDLAAGVAALRDGAGHRLLVAA